ELLNPACDPDYSLPAPLVPRCPHIAESGLPDADATQTIHPSIPHGSVPVTRLLSPHTSDDALYHCQTYSGVATWSQSAPSPSPPSGALVNKQIGT
ncbi:unnamed protein product, partial [Staurois parvus]